MTWTYEGNPGASDLAALRFTIGDTNPEDPQLTDEELDYLLAQRGSVAAAAISALEQLVRQYSRQADYSVGSLSVRASQRATMFRERLDELRSGSAALVAPAAPGIKHSTRADYSPVGDLVEPWFTRDPERYRTEE